MKTKKIPRWAIVILVLLLAVLLNAFFYRLSPFTTYIPFTGRLFSLEAEDAAEIKIISIELGFEETYLTDPEEIEEFCGILNSFRYSVILPEFLLPAYGGGDNHFWITSKDTGLQESVTFSEHCLIFRDVRFYPRNDALADLMEFVQGKS